MAPERTDDSSETEALASKTITERFNNLEAGDKVSVNNHERTYEIVDTDTYSVIAEDPDGNQVTFAQNLQSGGWVVNEDVSHVENV